VHGEKVNGISIEGPGELRMMQVKMDVFVPSVSMSSAVVAAP
jgi:hypothetical protein